MNSTTAALRPARTRADCTRGHRIWTRNPPGSVIMCWRCRQGGTTTRITVPGEPPPAPPPLPHPARRAWLLARLMEADGPGYDVLCRELIAASGADCPRWRASRMGVREVRLLLWDGLATTEPSDGSVWLTPAGWRLLDQMTGGPDGP